MNKILTIISALAVTVGFQACHDPEEVTSTGDPNGLLTLSAQFIDDELVENNFPAEIDYSAKTVTVVFPYNYPRESDNVLSEDALKKVRVVCSLSNNSTVNPPLTVMDLTRSNTITVTNPVGAKSVYTVKGEIRKSAECELKEITLASGISGIADNAKNVITLLAVEDIEPQTATYKLSAHATLSPDVSTEAFDFEAEGAKLTVTAQNGVDRREYTIVKGEPSKLMFGMRPGSERIMWLKTLRDAGCVVRNKQAGIGVTDKYVVINEKGTMNAVVLNAADGSDSGRKLDMNIIPNGMNHSMTSDDAGHILVNTMNGENGSLFKVWVFDDIDSKGREIISASIYGCGNRLSVKGDVTKDAIITAPMNGSNLDYFRWIVKDGVVGPVKQMHLNGVASTPWGNADVVATSATDANADVFTVFYALVNGTRGPVCYDGSGSVKYIGLLNTQKDLLDDAGNWVMNSCDYAEFNKGKFFFYNSVNTFSWGRNDLLYLMDVSGGNLKTHAVDFEPSGLDINNNYGAMAAGSLGMAGNANDTRLWVADNGFYMYAYFMFTNGYIGCVRVDCIDQ